jgi:hypothetical protein
MFQAAGDIAGLIAKQSLRCLMRRAKITFAIIA